MIFEWFNVAANIAIIVLLLVSIRTDRRASEAYADYIENTQDLHERITALSVRLETLRVQFNRLAAKTDRV